MPLSAARVAARHVASTGAECEFFKATDGRWYMGLENYMDWDDDDQDGDRDAEMEYYGPFPTMNAAVKYLNQNFANPGGWSEDDSGRQKPPRNPTKPTAWNARFSGEKPSKKELISLAESMMVADLGKQDGASWLKDPGRKKGQALLDYFESTYGDNWWEAAWKHRQKKAFNKFNPDELLGQLVTVLEKEGLDDAVKSVKKITPDIQKAWREREKQAATRTSPMEAITNPARWGYKVVDVFYGEARPRRDQSVAMKGDVLQDDEGNLWEFHGRENNRLDLTPV